LIQAEDQRSPICTELAPRKQNRAEQKPGRSTKHRNELQSFANENHRNEQDLAQPEAKTPANQRKIEQYTWDYNLTTFTPSFNYMNRTVPKIMDENMNSDVCTFWCCILFPFVARRLDGRGVVVSSGLNKLTALHTLGTVNIGRGKAVVQDIKRLTWLRKLGVVGVNKDNGKEFCSTLSTLSNLESLSVRSPGLDGLLVFDGRLLPPKNVRSLKLEGNLVKLPGWVNGLHNLVKLSLKRSMIAEQTAMEILGKLPNLALLRLQESSFQGAGLHFTLAAGAFPSLVVLELFHIGGYKQVFSVDFEATTTATPKLELLSVRGRVVGLSGLSSLQSLKEVLLDDCNTDDVVQAVKDQLERNPNKPVLKSVD
jgi:hypothetical protein